MERDGLFWVENLPLSAGANQVTFYATNAAGFVTTSTFTVNKSAVQITLDPMDAGLFTNFFVNVSGTISDSSYTVWVNGVKATIIGSAWNASSVPVNQGGTATLHKKRIGVGS